MTGDALAELPLTAAVAVAALRARGVTVRVERDDRRPPYYTVTAAPVTYRYGPDAPARTGEMTWGGGAAYVARELTRLAATLPLP